MRLGEARDGAQCRGLAGAVAPEQGDDLPFVHIEADVLDDVALAVESLEAPGREIGRLAGRARRQGRRLAPARREHRCAPQLGRASWRARVVKYVWDQVGRG